MGARKTPRKPQGNPLALPCTQVEFFPASEVRALVRTRNRPRRNSSSILSIASLKSCGFPGPPAGTIQRAGPARLPAGGFIRLISTLFRATARAGQLAKGGNRGSRVCSGSWQASRKIGKPRASYPVLARPRKGTRVYLKEERIRHRRVAHRPWPTSAGSPAGAYRRLALGCPTLWWCLPGAR